MKHAGNYAALGLACLMMAPAAAPAADFSAEEKTALQELVHEYIVNNPEVIVEAMQELERRKAQGEELADQEMISQNRDEIFNDGYSLVSGNPDGDVTVVEFFDYRCGYCKKAHDEVAALLKADPNIRFVHKEFPILGPESTYAARAAMAAEKQGEALWRAYSDALMSFNGQLTNALTIDIAEEAGLDREQLVADMEDPEIANRIRMNYDLARKLNIRGTPGFIIGDTVLRGYVPFRRMQDMVETARESG